MTNIPTKETLSNIPTITLSRFHLRPIQIEDAADMFSYGSDLEVTKWLTWESHKTVEDAYNSIQNYFLNRPSNNVPQAHAIIDNQTNKMIGTCDICRVDWETKTGEIGYCLHRDFWGLGYITEACKAVIQFGFEYLSLERIEIRHHPDNIGSRRVIEKCGFEYTKDTYYKPYDMDIPSYVITRDSFYDTYSPLSTALTFIKEQLQAESSGHDYLHALRVLENTKLLTKAQTNIQYGVIYLAAILHDIIDPKLEASLRQSTEDVFERLQSWGVSKEHSQHVIEIMNSISYSKKTIPNTIEGKIVQDADRLDALGAIGIARTFAYGGANNRLIYSLDNSTNDSLSHFYEKLFKLPSLMNTSIGKTLADKRVAFMKTFVETMKHEIQLDFTNQKQ